MDNKQYNYNLGKFTWVNREDPETWPNPLEKVLTVNEDEEVSSLRFAKNGYGWRGWAGCQVDGIVGWWANVPDPPQNHAEELNSLGRPLGDFVLFEADNVETWPKRFGEFIVLEYSDPGIIHGIMEWQGKEWSGGVWRNEVYGYWEQLPEYDA